MSSCQDGRALRQIQFGVHRARHFAIKTIVVFATILVTTLTWAYPGTAIADDNTTSTSNLSASPYSSGTTTDDADSAGSADDAETTYSVLYRLYNPFTGEHFYTVNKKERARLVKKGWHYEGPGWMAPSSGDEVYRVYNRYSGDHHYTTSAKERNRLVKKGWTDEGVGWFSSPESDVSREPLFRQYNPNAKCGTHNYTLSKSENKKLVKQGWTSEGIGWYGHVVDSSFEDDMEPWSAHISGNVELDTQLDMILLSHKTLRSCYDYVASFSYRSGNTFTANPHYLPDDTTIAYAKEMIAKKSGNCYRFAALFCWLARGLGYDANVVSGWVPSYSGGQAPHGWVEVTVDGQTLVCDPDMYEAIPDRNWYLVTYDTAPVTYGSW